VPVFQWSPFDELKPPISTRSSSRCAIRRRSEWQHSHRRTRATGAPSTPTSRRSCPPPRERSGPSPATTVSSALSPVCLRRSDRGDLLDRPRLLGPGHRQPSSCQPSSCPVSRRGAGSAPASPRRHRQRLSFRRQDSTYLALRCPSLPAAERRLRRKSSSCPESDISYTTDPFGHDDLGDFTSPCTDPTIGMFR
jgi:hypothetical protein